LDDNTDHRRLSIKNGLINRYRNPAKDYAHGKSRGEMIGSMRLGHHTNIVEKLKSGHMEQRNALKT
jgi:hypothetical protein